ncbi:MAG: putative lipid II flippase FtsW [Rhodospirillales bacterium]|jgi:cell division protein FtsW|nr:putative lipid II flippase FtsW [Rhodospirillales bacterium]MDP7215948.1 putative lipid II flippase FtsW [Rhodospirillales bacterium]HIJ42885.1 putative lipid II flippase FtsW [Rhodospirillaceae bacterium]HIJ44701.1 putative lipid II flippase FtsW [Rhodospirillaceae bacterium]HJP53785.1 putative lipid II flippase FtsW [Rhodospirillales bacterium]
MSTFPRTDTSLIGRWWWTVDRWSLTALTAIALIGALMTLAASPPVAERLGLDTFHFVRRQFFFLLLASAVMLATSLLTSGGIRRLAAVVFAVTLVFMVAVLITGEEINGARRWLRLGALSIQPSEFIKPAFAVVAAWMFAKRRQDEHFPGDAITAGFFILVASCLLLQPDVGMSILVAAVWGAQLLLAGLPLTLVAVVALLFLSGAVAAYFTFTHVRIRVDSFLDPSAGDNYQVMRSLDAFRNGGLFGRGPGEGRIKEILPDAHADFIFAVTGEEFGLIVCLLLVGLFAFVVLRGFSRVFRDNDLFVLLVVAGLLVQFGLQAIINMASSLQLMPPKGMTLPFISYGGSSTLALAWGLGMVLALTRERPGPGRLE